MVTFSLNEDDGDGDDYRGVEAGSNPTDSVRRFRRRPLNPMMTIDSLDDYDLQKSFEAMDRHKFQKLTTRQAYQILLALGYLGNGRHHTDQQRFPFEQFQNDVDHLHGLESGRCCTLSSSDGRRQQQSILTSAGDKNSGEDAELVTLQMLMKIIEKVSSEIGSIKGKEDILPLQSFLTLWYDCLLKKIEKNSDVLKRNRSENLDHLFSVLDQDGKGYLTADDLLRISDEIDGSGGGDGAALRTQEEAQVMAELTLRSSSTPSSSRSTTTRVSSTDFRRLLAPPSP